MNACIRTLRKIKAYIAYNQPFSLCTVCLESDIFRDSFELGFSKLTLKTMQYRLNLCYLIVGAHSKDVTTIPILISILLGLQKG